MSNTTLRKNKATQSCLSFLNNNRLKTTAAISWNEYFHFAMTAFDAFRVIPFSKIKDINMVK
jgi:hypothetical protein